MERTHTHQLTVLWDSGVTDASDPFFYLYPTAITITTTISNSPFVASPDPTLTDARQNACDKGVVEINSKSKKQSSKLLSYYPFFGIRYKFI